MTMNMTTHMTMIMNMTMTLPNYEHHCKSNQDHGHDNIFLLYLDTNITIHNIVLSCNITPTVSTFE